MFLTRDGCVNTANMRTRLDEALDRLSASKDYAVIDADTLPHNDLRLGYGTPTILYRNRDLFGLPEPRLAAPMPTTSRSSITPPSAFGTGNRLRTW